MKADKDMLEAMISDFSVLSEENKRKIIETTKFLVHTQNIKIPELLAENRTRQIAKRSK